jgi:hypothetical protein
MHIFPTIVIYWLVDKFTSEQESVTNTFEYAHPYTNIMCKRKKDVYINSQMIQDQSENRFMKRSSCCCWNVLTFFFSQRSKLAKLDSGLDESPTVMVREAKQNGWNKGILKHRWAFLETNQIPIYRKLPVSHKGLILYKNDFVVKHEMLTVVAKLRIKLSKNNCRDVNEGLMYCEQASPK